jgi:hypothetical protein
LNALCPRKSEGEGSAWVHARIEKDHVEIVVECLSWKGSHTPIPSFEVAEILTGNPCEQDIEAARKRALSNKKYFQVCSVCKELAQAGYMHCEDKDEGDESGGVCMACAPGCFGIVY